MSSCFSLQVLPDQRSMITTMMEPMTGLEPVTSSLPRTRSTTELHRRMSLRSTRDASRLAALLLHALSSRPAVRAPRGSRCDEQELERETGIEPATNSLEGCDSTAELLPPSRSNLRLFRRASPLCAGASVRHLGSNIGPPIKVRRRRARPSGYCGRRLVARGGFEPPKPLGATDLQSVAFDRSATSPILRSARSRNRVSARATAACAGRLTDRRRTLPQQIVLWNSSCFVWMAPTSKFLPTTG